MKLFPTPEFKTPYSVSDYPVQVDPRHPLYSQVELYASDPNLVIFIDSCVATPTMYPTDSIRYSFIKNGYVHLKYHKIPNGCEEKSLKMMLFLEL